MATHIFNQQLLNTQNFDAIILPGGLEGAQTFRDNPLLIETLKNFMEDEKKVIGAICASPAVVLSHHNLIEEYDYITCHPSIKKKID